MANEKNLIPNNKRSPSEVRENGKKGGKKSGEARRKKKQFKDCMIQLLDADLEKFIGGRLIEQIIVDPSATSFITLIRRKGKYSVRTAKNEVIDGIRNTASAMSQGLIKIDDTCTESIKELQMYSWNEKATEDTPLKEYDHHCDRRRYFVQTNRLVLPDRKSLLKGQR